LEDANLSDNEAITHANYLYLVSLWENKKVFRESYNSQQCSLCAAIFWKNIFSCFRGWFTNNQSSTALIELQIYLFKLWIQRSNR